MVVFHPRPVGEVHPWLIEFQKNIQLLLVEAPHGWLNPHSSWLDPLFLIYRTAIWDSDSLNPSPRKFLVFHLFHQMFHNDLGQFFRPRRSCVSLISQSPQYLLLAWQLIWDTWRGTSGNPRWPKQNRRRFQDEKIMIFMVNVGIYQPKRW